ncbi:MAG: sulfotransferase [Myxococcota bacterium]|nr:sulfotransferase [Myxococcota bacterium]
MQERLVFVICPPRSGSTMIQQMLASHSKVCTHPEPHLITPLQYLGYFKGVERAPYDQVNSGQAIRELVEELPRKEADYLEALRAYTNHLYGCLLAKGGATYFVDKTPAYALVLPFLKKLYPDAHYLVLTRHPLAIFHSVARSFFGGDYEAALVKNPIQQGYIGAIATFLREPPKNCRHITYERLVQRPEETMRAIASFIGLDFEPDMVTYGNQKHLKKSFGDPMTVHKHREPKTDSVVRFAPALKGDTKLLDDLRALLAAVAPEDLAEWGYTHDSLFGEISSSQAKPARAPLVNSYVLRKTVLSQLRKSTKHPRVARLFEKVKYACELALNH